MHCMYTLVEDIAVLKHRLTLSSSTNHFLINYTLYQILTKLTIWSKGLLNKLMVTQLVKFPAFYGT